MDMYILSQAFATATLCFKTGGAYMQAKYPDSHTMKKVVVPAYAATAFSYALCGVPTAAVSYTCASVRNKMLQEEWWQTHKNALTACNLGIVAGVTALTAERAVDTLALIGTIGATIGDYQGQGRYQRLAYFLTRKVSAMPLAFVNQNWMMLASDVASHVFNAKSIYEHDVKNASGQKSTLTIQNFKAYIHGIFNDSTTGASVKGQTCSNAGRNDMQEQYMMKMRNKVNPYFEPQK